ncbi:hypothetical protein CLS_30760 [[Clostridium] cf. saccharolyticum K10]|nr:hypothetical protein CLS_30760 [[Clostridium] cf. saccharolyticum K10]
MTGEKRGLREKEVLRLLKGLDFNPKSD